MKANSLKAAACSLLVASSVPVEASPQYFLEFSGITGGSTSKLFKSAIDLQSFQWGIDIQFPEDPRGRPVLAGTDFSWTQGLDVSVPQILEALGTPIKTATLHGVTETGGTPLEFFKMTFTDAFITSFKISGESREPSTVDGVFTYSLLEMKVTPQKEDGSAGESKTGKFSKEGFVGANEVFAQIANFEAPLLETTPVPLPTALPFLLSGLAGLGLAGIRNTKSRTLEAAE